MSDPRYQKLAKVLTHYSLAIRPGDKLAIEGGAIAAPLIQEVYREAIRAGAYVSTYISLDGLREIELRESSDEQLIYISELEKIENEYFDAQLTIWSEQNTKHLGGIHPERIAKRLGARADLTKRWSERVASGALRWCGTLFPTHGYAQDAGMSLSDYEDFVFQAGMLDHNDPVAAWLNLSQEQQRLADFLNQRDEIRIIAPDTDITYKVGGRQWINCAGRENFPDGEIFSSPIEDSMSGHIRFSFPAVYEGNEVEDVQLVFQHGKVVEASARRGLNFLQAMLDTDPGARFVGEVAFGLNYRITRFSKESLFDEKIGGTMHLALGESYPESGGVNDSGLHWDMVCDLHEGKVYADGQLCYENGRFIVS